MDFAPTEGQSMIQGLAAEVLGRLADDPRLRRALATDGHDRVAWAGLAEAGLLAAFLPEEEGGGGLGFLELCSLLVEVGRAALPVPLLPTLGAAHAIGSGGSRASRARWLPGVGAGETVLSVGLVDVSGRDPRRPTARASLDTSGWCITGRYLNVPAASHAQAFVVGAADDRGPALFLVEATAVDVSSQPTTGDGGTGVVSLVAAPAERLGGADALGELYHRLLLGQVALQLGLASEAVARTARYVSSRHQFGVPVGSFQAVSQRLADAYIETQVMEVALWRAAARLHHGEEATREVHLARALACDGAHRVLAAAQHLHGGMGFDRDYPLHRYWLLGKQLEFTLGGATEHYAALGAWHARMASSSSSPA